MGRKMEDKPKTFCVLNTHAERIFLAMLEFFFHLSFQIFGI